VTDESGLFECARETAPIRVPTRDGWWRPPHGVTPVKFGISFTLSHYNQAGALVHIYQAARAGEPWRAREMGGPAHQDLGVRHARARAAGVQQSA